MYPRHWLIIFIINLALSLVSPFHPGGLVSARQGELPLSIILATTQAEVIVGDAMTWRVSLTPQSQERIEAIQVRSGDNRVWVFLGGPQSIRVLTNTVVLDVPAVPLVAGKLTPLLEVDYSLGRKTYSQLIAADRVVEVASVESRVQADIVVTESTAHQGDPLPLELRIHNHSPFTLTQLQVEGRGTDLVWADLTTLADIPPYQNTTQRLSPTLNGQYPLPEVNIAYTWTDLTGTTHHWVFNVRGDMMTLVPDLLGRIPDEAFGILIGVIAGALSTFITGLVGAWVARILQKRQNRRHAHGLLQLLTLQAEYAADNGVLVELESLSTIFKQEGLFTILNEDRLDEDAREFWKIAERHNAGLNLPGGAQRTDELRKVTHLLKQKLKIISEGPK